MVNKLNASFFIVLLIVGLLWTSCATKKAAGPSYLGKWKYEVPDMPGDDNTGVLIISKDGDVYTCVAVTDFGYEQPMDIFDIQEDSLMASYDSQGTTVVVGGTFEENTIKGTISAQGMVLDWSAIKVE